LKWVVGDVIDDFVEDWRDLHFPCCLDMRLLKREGNLEAMAIDDYKLLY